MKEYIIGPNEAGQRLDKYLKKLLSEAPNSFLYKMLRKKNITLNRKAADGSTRLAEGDRIFLFLSDETIGKFTRKISAPEKKQIPAASSPKILYEDRHVLLLNKPAGLLSQPDASHQTSMVEWVTSYLLESGALSPEDLRTFHPGICNRLDRNTSGILAAGKTLPGLQSLSEAFRERKMRKYYLCLVYGQITAPFEMQGYLHKNKRTNQVSLKETPSEDSVPVHTRYTPVNPTERVTLLEAELITGKTHQIRAQLSSRGNPIVGDPKYGNLEADRILKKRVGSFAQLLHAVRLEFGEMQGPLSGLSQQTLTAPVPELFERVNKEIMNRGH